MNSPISLTLEQFNQQVLACQDDAFTLAIFLVGDEELACQIVQEVVLNVYAIDGGRTQPIDLQMLQGVIFSCRRLNRSPISEVKTIPGWEQLDRCEQEALLLVDIFGKTYQDAAFILSNSWQEICQNVAMGRRSLARSMSAKIVPCEKEFLSK